MTLIKVSNTASHDSSVTFEFSVSPSLTLFGCVTALKSLLTWVRIPVKDNWVPWSFRSLCCVRKMGALG